MSVHDIDMSIEIKRNIDRLRSNGMIYDDIKIQTSQYVDDNC